MRQEESKAQCLGRKECFAGLIEELSNVCKGSVCEGRDPTKDVWRNEHVLKLVNKVHEPGSLGNMPGGFQDHERRHC